MASSRQSRKDNVRGMAAVSLEPGRLATGKHPSPGVARLQEAGSSEPQPSPRGSGLHPPILPAQHLRPWPLMCSPAEQLAGPLRPAYPTAQNVGALLLTQRPTRPGRPCPPPTGPLQSLGPQHSWRCSQGWVVSSLAPCPWGRRHQLPLSAGVTRCVPGAQLSGLSPGGRAGDL